MDPLLATDLHCLASPEDYGFETTKQVEAVDGALGQGDAIEALRFGISIEAEGHNVFVLGPPGSGRRTFVRQLLDAYARQGETPRDWCYVFNFVEPRRPRTLSLPPGRARELQQDMEELVGDLRKAIPEALRSDDVATRREAMIRRHGQEATAVMDALREKLVEDEYVGLIGDKGHQIVVPAQRGEPIAEERYEALPEELRRTIDEHVAAAGEHVQAAQREVQQLGRHAREQVERLHRDVAGALVRTQIELLRSRYAGLEEVLEYLDRVAADMLQHVAPFAAEDQAAPDELVGALQTMGPDGFFDRYRVNALICRDAGSGRPVVEAPNPNLRSLFGRTEGQLRFGVMVTHFSRITPGAAHRANGGFLVLGARELLSLPLAWPTLKRTLRTGELRPADAAAEIGLSASDSLDPEPIPARMKVVLMGEPGLYYLLRSIDSEFDELFKVKVDFSPWMDRTPAAEAKYASFIAGQCASLGLPPFTAAAVARVVEEGSRLAGDQTKLTTRFAKIGDLLTESAHTARATGVDHVDADAVDDALGARKRRNQRPHREILDLIRRGTLDFRPVGEAVGQVYGIGLLQADEEPFGRPIRVMASAFLGTGGLVNIEREASMSGPIHNKGFLVLSGYLGKRFAARTPLILSANLSFDQLYEEVEGDSASVAELIALMSAIGRIPLRQGIAVTGALNQDGLVLPVGGVTQKVEGFYAACAQVGLDGNQGVILPRSNVENLTVGAEVREAVARGKFRVWAIQRVDDAWPILADLPAGEPDEDGRYPDDSAHRRVVAQLEDWAAEWRRFGSHPDTGGG